MADPTDPPANPPTDPPTNPPADPPKDPPSNPQPNTHSGDDKVSQALEGVNTTLKGVAEMVAKMPETIGNILKVESGNGPPTEPAKPNSDPPKPAEPPSEPKTQKQKAGAGNRFSNWYYGNK